MAEIYFDGNKPTKVQILKKVRAAIQNGSCPISIFWGENWIDLDYSFNSRSWFGNGWIKNIGGDDLANELNKLN